MIGMFIAGSALSGVINSLAFQLSKLPYAAQAPPGGLDPTQTLRQPTLWLESMTIHGAVEHCPPLISPARAVCGYVHVLCCLRAMVLVLTCLLRFTEVSTAAPLNEVEMTAASSSRQVGK